ncbi:MAG: 30S ribosomal protein S21 [Candidatus Sungbacteria bacterium]|nr:30S ribosomal protein S21 [Candidatus Sungbacteria bacterium]
MVEVRRRQHETTGAMLRRFTRRVQQSGILINARRLKSYKPAKSKRQTREHALRREQKTAERMRLDKLGKLPEPVRGHARF